MSLDTPLDTRIDAPPAPPVDVQIIQLATGHIVARAVHAFAELGVADLLIDGPRTADEIAPACGAQSSSLYRLLRTVGGFGLVAEDASGRFALTPLGATLRSDAPGRARSAVRILTGPVGWRSLGELLHAVKTGDPAMDKAYGQSIFEYLQSAPEDATLFNELMIAFHGSEPPAVAAAYDFTGVRTLVDVGGGTGNLLTTLLLANPTLRGVLHDLPHVTAQARELIASRSLSTRCDVSEGSFFDAVPEGGDAYLLSHIIHDWDEASCLRIFDNIRRVLPSHGRLLLVEMVIPPGNDFHPSKLSDLIMLTFTPGGRERTEQEYAALFAKAGLKLTRVVPTASPVSVIEAAHA
jgi:O-methyltransferase domain/Dimerisation domain